MAKYLSRVISAGGKGPPTLREEKSGTQQQQQGCCGHELCQMWHQVHLLCQRLQPTPRAGHTCVKCARQTGCTQTKMFGGAYVLRMYDVRGTARRVRCTRHPYAVRQLARARPCFISERLLSPAFLLRTLHQCPRLATKFKHGYTMQRQMHTAAQ